MIVYAKHPPWDHRIGLVVQDMRRLGPPALKGIMFEGNIFALEGSHRLAAAEYLFLSPIFTLVQPDVPDSGLVDFWHLARERLPQYRFPHLLVRVPISAGWSVYGTSGQ
jgi:hypothetical protein